MEQNSPIIDDVDDGTLEAFVTIMGGDPALAANTIADVLEAANAAAQNPAIKKQMIYHLVNELGEDCMAFLATALVSAQRRKALTDRMPFIRWIEQLGPDSLVDHLLDASETADWPKPETYSEYREYLIAEYAARRLGSEALEHFQQLWARYAKLGDAHTGGVDNLAPEWEYRVEMVWSDGHREQHPNTATDSRRVTADRIYERESFPGRRPDGEEVSPVLQRRLTVRGPWVDMSPAPSVR